VVVPLILMSSITKFPSLLLYLKTSFTFRQVPLTGTNSSLWKFRPPKSVALPISSQDPGSPVILHFTKTFDGGILFFASLTP